VNETTAFCSVKNVKSLKPGKQTRKKLFLLNTWWVAFSSSYPNHVDWTLCWAEEELQNERHSIKINFFIFLQLWTTKRLNAHNKRRNLQWEKRQTLMRLANGTSVGISGIDFDQKIPNSFHQENSTETRITI